MTITMSDMFLTVGLDNLLVEREFKAMVTTPKYGEKKLTRERNTVAREALKSAGFKTQYRYKAKQKGLAQAMANRMAKAADYPVCVDETYAIGF